MKEKKVSLILVVVIVILLIAIAGMGVWYITQKNDGSVENSITQGENSNSQTMTTSEKYKVYAENLNKKIKGLKDESTQPDGLSANNELSVRLDNTFNSANGILEAYIDYNGDAYLRFKDTKVFSQYNTDGKYKVKSGVIALYVGENGNGGYSTLYMINSEGKVSYINSPDLKENKIIVEEKNVKDIVSIQTCSTPTACVTLAIDIDGNAYEI